MERSVIRVGRSRIPLCSMRATLERMSKPREGEMKKITAATVLFAVAAGAAFAQNSTAPSRGNAMATVSPDVVKSLAPTGTLRAGINLGNIVLAQSDASGQLGGVTVELARELGRRLG